MQCPTNEAVLLWCCLIMYLSNQISRLLNNNQRLQGIVVIALFSFLTYSSIYGFRKPFTAGTYTSFEPFGGIDYKIWLVIAQVAGYALSKFIGIRFISGIGFQKRGISLIGIALVAELCLLGFACTPAPWNIGWMFLNGIPLGMGWGLVFGYLEGRKNTDLFASILCINFIVSSGFSKYLGRWLVEQEGVREEWMPFVAGLIFLPFLIFSVWILEHLKGPSTDESDSCSERKAMETNDRRDVLKKFGLGLAVLSTAYLVLTILRDVRDNFSVEIWENLGFFSQPSLFIKAELPIALVILILVSSLNWVRNHFNAFQIIHWMSFSGVLLMGIFTFLFKTGQLSPMIWMIASGSGLFLPYVLFNGSLFDRFIAAFKVKGNVGFLMYIADSVGYLGSVLVLVWKNLGGHEVSWLTFFINLCYLGTGVLLILLLVSWLYFRKKHLVTQE